MRPRVSTSPVIKILNGTFYRHHPNAHTSHPNPPLFPNLTFELPSAPDPPHNWCVVGPSLSGKTTLLHILRGRLLCQPPTARTFPYLSSEAVPHHLRSPERAIQYVGFDGERMGGGISDGVTTSAYLSARYESRREKTDFSLRDYLLGNTELNPLEKKQGEETAAGSKLFEQAVTDLKLDHLLQLPVAFLSNGQGRRARIARALLAAPEVLLLDEPFMGLDPPTVKALSPLLESLARQASPRLVLSARPQDSLPEWVTHVAYLRDECQVEAIGRKELVVASHKVHAKGTWKGLETEKSDAPQSFAAEDVTTTASQAEKLVEMDGCQVKYGNKIALGNWTQQTPSGSKDGLVWTVRRGERWGVFGPNGSGKTTIVSLLCSDHPQTYSLPIRLFGMARLPERGSGKTPLTFWDIQSRVGHSSPEVHQHMPRGLTIRQVIENAWADTFKGKPKLDGDAPARVEAALRWFAKELHPNYSSQTMSNVEDVSSWADEYLLGELSFSAQRVALLIRAVIKSPDIVVLDEAFSGMDETVRDKCMLFLAAGEEKVCNGSGTVESEACKAGNITLRGLSERQALICISHIKEEVPDCVREWVCLPEANSGHAARFGSLRGPLRDDNRGWSNIWGL